MIQFPMPGTSLVSCANGCGKTLNPDSSHRYGVGLSHYRLDSAGGVERSYVQLFYTPHSCSQDCAIALARQHISVLPAIPRGTYTPGVHNPNGEQADEVVRRNVEYNQDGVMAEAALPKSCAICGTSLSGKDVFLPHVDDSTLGTHYQDVLLKQPAFAGKSVEDVTLGACTMEHATQLAGAILDEVLLPSRQGKPVVIGGARDG